MKKNAFFAVSVVILVIIVIISSFVLIIGNSSSHSNCFLKPIDADSNSSNEFMGVHSSRARANIKINDPANGEVVRDTLTLSVTISGWATYIHLYIDDEYQGSFELADPSNPNHILQIDVGNWQPGKYKISVQADADYPPTPGDPIVSVEIFVNQNPNPPVANAGLDQAVEVNTPATLDGSGSNDPDGNALTYRWTQTEGPEAALSDATAVKPTFTPTVPGTYRFQLVVNNGGANSAPSYVTITVTKANNPPVADAGRDQTVEVNTQVTLNGNASYDPDGDTITYKWTQVEGSTTLLLYSTTNKSMFTPTINGIYKIQLVVNDSKANSEPSVVTITVVTAKQNIPPVADAGKNQTIEINIPVTLDGSGSYDQDNDAITSEWTQIGGPAAVTMSNTTDVKPTFTPTIVGIYKFSLVVNDNKTNSAPDTVTITVTKANNPPTAEAGADQIVEANTSATLDGTTSSDMDGDTLTYKWTQTSGSAINISNSNVAKIIITPTIAGNCTFSLTVNDGKVNSSDSVAIMVVSLLDTDNDDIRDSIEKATGTDPYNNDTDGDGLLDGIEDKNCDGIFQRGEETDPRNPDTDGDGFLDGQEDANHSGTVDPTETDPKNPDTDFDGLNDYLDLYPTIKDNKYSFGQAKDEAFTVYRTNKKTFTPTLRLDKTTARNLTFQWKYKMPDGNWNDTVGENLTQDLVWSESTGCWQITFTTAKASKLGSYGIAFRVNYSNAVNTSWIYNVRILDVKNNVPAISNFAVSKKQFNAGNSTAISFNGSDAEDANLSATVQYYISGNWANITTVNASNNSYSASFGQNLSPGKYGIRVRLADKDNGTTEWKYENISILSTAAPTVPTEFSGVNGNTFHYDFVELAVSLLVSIAVLVVTTTLVMAALKNKGVTGSRSISKDSGKNAK
ncbi:MAG: PKD domain-containing protein [Thermoplasmata archaeon]